MSERQAYRARWVFPVDAPPLENGVVEVQAGQITAVHDRAEPAAQDLGNVALIPGLVNVHTHLEFSDLPQPIQPALPFTDWIRALVSYRRSETATTNVIEKGIQEAETAGTTCLGEIATPVGPVLPAEAGDHANGRYTRPYGSRVVEFLELLGLAAEQHEAQLALARDHLSQPTQPGVIYGLSPHAPYSVRPPLYRALVELAKIHDCPLAIHLAETQAELQLLAEGTGEFVDLLSDFGVWDPTAIGRGTRPLDYLQPLAVVAQALVIHGNYLNETEIDFLVEHRNISVVYCPRTHAYFRHSPHPWQQMLERGVSLALGTDSRGSNPDLSLWRELQFLREQFPNVDPALLLELGTIRGAQALGIASELGTLTSGKSADMVVVTCSASGNEPYEMLLNSESVVSATMCRGEWLREIPDAIPDNS